MNTRVAGPAMGASRKAIYRNVTVLPSVLYYPHTRPSPFFGGVYADGVPVPQASDLRGKRQQDNQAPLLPATAVIDVESIYCGPFRPHFGHFLLEALSRVYYARQYPDLPLVFSRECKLAGYHKDIFQLLGIHNRITSISEPTFFPTMHIPVKGFVIDLYVLDEQIRAMGVVEPEVIVPGKKIYLSRSRLPQSTGGAVNEKDLDALLEDRGWLIYHPQEHPIREQLREISSSETVLAIEGSALHSVLLLTDPVKTRFFSLLRHQNPQEGRAYSQIAQAKKLAYDSIAVPAVFFTPAGPGQTQGRMRLDLDFITRLLNETDDLSSEADSYTLKLRKRFDSSEVRRIGLYADTVVSDEARLLYPARLSLDSGDTTTAISRFQQALAVGAEPSHVHHHLSLAYALRGKGEKALSQARLAVESGELCPQYVNRYCELCRTGPNSCNISVHTGLQHIQSGRAGQARSLFSQALSRKDSCALLHYLQSLALVKESPEAAATEACRALELAPASRLYAHNLVNIHLGEKRAQQAMQVLRRVIARFPEHIWSYGELLPLLIRQKNHKGLRHTLEVALPLPDFIPRYGNRIADLLIKHEFLVEAENLLLQALRTVPHEAWVYYQLSRLPSMRAKDNKAVSLARAATRLNPSPQYVEHLLDLLLDRDDFEAARSILHDILDEFPSEAWAHYRLGLLFELSGDLDKAKSSLHAAATLSIGIGRHWHGLISFLIRTGDHAGAERMLAEAREQAPDTPWLRVLSGQLDEARKRAEQFRPIAGDPGFLAGLDSSGPGAPGLPGPLAADKSDPAQEQRKRKRRRARNAMRMWKDVFLGCIAGLCGDRKRHIAYFRSAVERSRSLAWYWYALIAALLKNKDYTGAGEIAGKGLSLDPAEPRLHYNLSKIFLARGEFAKALKCARVAASIDEKNRRYADNLQFLLRKNYLDR